MADSERDPAYGPERRVPSAGADPLLARPIVATGETGQIQRPGDDRSPWLVPVLFVGFVALIAGLVVVGTSDDANDASDSVLEVAQSSEAGAGTDADADAGIDPSTDPNSATDPSVDTAAPESNETPVTASIDSLPAAGFVRVGEADFAIESACVDHQPLAPDDIEFTVSSYFFRDADGVGRVVDHRRNAPDGRPAAMSGASLVDGTYAAVGADGGGFVAQFDALSVAVAPAPSAGVDCSNTMVTNEPGQLAFPHTRIVLASCTDGGDAAGITSEGGRFDIEATGEATASIVVTLDDGVGGLVELADPAAEGFEGDDRVGYSGIVRAGDLALDITVDIPIDAAATCP